LLDNRPVAGDAVGEKNAQRVEHRRPEPIETSRLNHRNKKDQIDHEEDHALQVNGDDFARQSGHREKQAAEKEHLHGHDGEVQLRQHRQVNGADPRVIGPGRE
jgi:hypothetical protein